jgi:hypothetical protein
MASNQKRLLRAEVEKCEFDGRPLRLVTGWVRGRKGSRMLTRLTALRLKTGHHQGKIPREIRDVLFS